MLGIPTVGMATTEMTTAIRNGWNGYVETDLATAIAHMKRLIGDRHEALRLSTNARLLARERFGIDRFAREWDDVLTGACTRQNVPQPPQAQSGATRRCRWQRCREATRVGRRPEARRRFPLKGC